MQQLPAIPDIFKLKQSSGSPRRFQEKITIFLFLLPAVALFLIFVLYPILQSVYYSLFDWKGFGPAVDFVGLENFKNILGDKAFLKGLTNALLIVVFSLVIQLPLSLMLAVFVGRDLPGRVFFPHRFFYALRSFRSNHSTYVVVHL
jgi:raffinose/stachyose/melibiose transport system permease protein